LKNINRIGKVNQAKIEKRQNGGGGIGTSVAKSIRARHIQPLCQSRISLRELGCLI
jgi:hypothetical protein